jgi:hypothetical protein
MKYLTLIFAFLFIGCCHQGEHHITVYNNSQKGLYCRTFINSKNESFNYYLKKNHTSDIGIGIGKEDSEIIDKHPSEKIIFVMYFDSIEYISPNENFERLKIKQNLILKKYSKEELENLNWKIDYK